LHHKVLYVNFIGNMSPHQVNDALIQVKRLQSVFLAKQRFGGYSGPARMVSGCAALVVAWLLDHDFVYTDPKSYLKAWLCLLLFSLVLNYASLLRWFLFDPKVKRDFARLSPALEAVSPLAVGAVLTLVLVSHEFYFLLYGMWMCLFGAANIASRHVMPRFTGVIGFGYIVAGAICMLHSEMSFFNPWPMGIVFFVGEWLAGLLLYVDHKRGELE
jgi:hypothetical protein